MNIDLNIRIYIIIVCIPLIPLGIIRNLKNLVVFSAVATVFIMVGIAFTLYFTGE
jgi:Transmembrane amino acid transporter protein.